MFKTRVTDLLGIEYPIIQGGLASLSFAELAAAVTNAGGLGQIVAAYFHDDPAGLRAEIAKARQLTDKPFAVNVAMGRAPLHHLLEVVLEEGVPVASFTGGDPTPYFEQAKGAEVKKLVLVASTRQAQKAEGLGADAVMAVGFEGGGHLGRDDVGTLVLVPRVVDSVSIPVIASGGIGDGRGLVAALALGAEGIEMGTRFVATQECRAHPNYKEALVKAREMNTVIIKRTIRQPARALRGPFADRILAAEADGVGLEGLLPLIKGERNRRAAVQGELDEGYAWAGQVVGLIDDVPTVAELVERILAQAREIAAGVEVLASETAD